MPKQPDCKACSSPNFSDPCFDHVAMVDIATVDGLWNFVKRWLDNYVDNGSERGKARLLLIRRLRHPETVGLSSGPPHTEPESRIHPKARGGPMPRLDPVRCICGDVFADHDEDGECTTCHCTMFSTVPS
jgi:hypothetical protein